MRFIITANPDPKRPRDPSAPPPSADLVIAAMKYNEELFKAGVLIAAEGLHPGGQGARIEVINGERVVVDGPFVETKELIGGFYLIEVASREEAIAWALRCPVGLGFDDVLTIHQMTDAEAIPPEFLKIITEAAPTWSASFTKTKSK